MNDSELFELCKSVRTCSVDSCERKHYGKTFCKMHYGRYMNHGNSDKLSHGKSYTPEYHIWSSMVQRCTNPKNPKYSDYGGRGINIYEPWLKFSNFLADIGYRPNPSAEIDRIDNNLGYQPDNVRWSSRSEQNNNRRGNRTLDYKGETHTIAEWSKKLNIKYDTLYIRIYRGWSIERALNG
jgi:hypothetical protein